MLCGLKMQRIFCAGQNRYLFRNIGCRDRNGLEAGKAIIHQRFGVSPFIALVGRPAAGKDRGYKSTVVPFCGTAEAVAGIAGKTGLDADCSRIAC